MAGRKRIAGAGRRERRVVRAGRRRIIRVVCGVK